MIDSLTLKFGRAPGGPGETIPMTPVTVFVGPNNSGKSRILQEIERFCRSGKQDTNQQLLAAIEFQGMDGLRAAQSIERLRQPPNPGEAQNVDHIFVGSR